MTCCPTGVAWLLLASYAVLLGVGDVGIWVSVNNFWEDEPLPPVPPQEPEITTTTTTTTPYPYQYNYRDYDRRDDRILAPETYKEYVYATRHFASITSDARLYMVVPCVASIVVATLVLVAGLKSRQFFSSTFSLYSSLCLWILTLTSILVFESKISQSFVVWIVGFQTGLMLLLSAQIVLSVWELRRSRSGWPTINLRSLFTIEVLFVAARITLTVFTILSLADSQIIRGYSVGNENRFDDFDRSPAIRYPLALTLACLSATCYSAVATVETALSMLLGKLHNCMTGLSTLVSALCCTTAAVITSPVVVRAVIQPTYIYPETMYFCIGLSVVTFLHVIACVGFPVASRSTPEIVDKILSGVVPAIRSLGSIRMNGQLWQQSVPENKEKVNFIFNFASSIFTVVSLITITAGWDSPLYRAWGSVLVMCANSAILVRTLPPVVMQLKFKQPENTPVYQKLMSLTLETVALLVGSIAMCARLYHGIEIFAGMINLLFSAFQIFIIVQLLKSNTEVIRFMEEERLTNTEEGASQDGTDEQTPHDDLLA